MLEISQNPLLLPLGCLNFSFWAVPIPVSVGDAAESTAEHQIVVQEPLWVGQGLLRGDGAGGGVKPRSCRAPAGGLVWRRWLGDALEPQVQHFFPLLSATLPRQQAKSPAQLLAGC